MNINIFLLYSKYVYKTTGPEWKQLLQMEVKNINQKVVKMSCYQSGQAKLHNRRVGEIVIPLPLIQIIHPAEATPSSSSTTTATASGGTGRESQANSTESMSSTGSSGSTGSIGLSSKTTKNSNSTSAAQLDPALMAAINGGDELLASVNPADIPQPSYYPIKYTWNDNGDTFHESNGEMFLTIFMVPKGGSLFGK